MKAIVSGLVNIETNIVVNVFPLEYFPIDYPFFGVESSVGGVGYNISLQKVCRLHLNQLFYMIRQENVKYIAI